MIGVERRVGERVAATVEQRVSYIEGRLDALATKADLTQAISELRAELSRDMSTPRHVRQPHQ